MVVGIERYAESRGGWGPIAGMSLHLHRGSEFRSAMVNALILALMC